MTSGAGSSNFLVPAGHILHYSRVKTSYRQVIGKIQTRFPSCFDKRVLQQSCCSTLFSVNLLIAIRWNKLIAHSSGILNAFFTEIGQFLL